MINEWKEGVNFFRIVEITNSGTHLYSTTNKQTYGKDEKITLSPNPTKDAVSLTFDGLDKHFVVNVYDALGEKMESFQLQNTEHFKIGASYSFGLYFVEVVTSHNTQMFKFLKEA